MMRSATGATKLARHIRNIRRNSAIIIMNQEGEEPKNIARKFNITVWAVYKICHQATAKPQADPRTATRSDRSSRTF